MPASQSPLIKVSSLIPPSKSCLVASLTVSASLHLGAALGRGTTSFSCRMRWLSGGLLPLILLPHSSTSPREPAQSWVRAGGSGRPVPTSPSCHRRGTPQLPDQMRGPLCASPFPAVALASLSPPGLSYLTLCPCFLLSASATFCRAGFSSFFSSRFTCHPSGTSLLTTGGQDGPSTPPLRPGLSCNPGDPMQPSRCVPPWAQGLRKVPLGGQGRGDACSWLPPGASLLGNPWAACVCRFPFM